MAIIYHSDKLPKSLAKNTSHNLWVYNGLDCNLTYELDDVLEPQLDVYTTKTYTLERALQNCTMDMQLQGILINQASRLNLIQIYQQEIDNAQTLLNKLAMVFWDKPLNPRSPKQCSDFFYTFLRIPPVLRRSGGRSRPTTDDNALGSIAKNYLWARPFVKLIAYIRDKSKTIGSLRGQLSPDGRMRAKFSVAGTETGRFSSAKDNYGDGLNLQNQNERVKRMYVADEGRKFAYIDLEQAESRMLGLFVHALFDDPAYLDACEGEDLHTTVCRMIWKDLGWTGDIKQDRPKADSPFARHFTYRDLSKRAGHGTNYWGQPGGMARNLGVDTQMMEDFQEAYFSAFPGIKRYHAWIIQQLQTTRTLITPFGRKRVFFGRPDDNSTIREAIAYMPQSSIGDLMNVGMWKVWKNFSGKKVFCAGKRQPLVQLHAQVHDAILVSYPEHLEDEIVPKLLETIPHPLNARGRDVIIPCSAETGWNWGQVDGRKRFWADGNPDGLIEYTGNDERKRQCSAVEARSLLGATIL